MENEELKIDTNLSLKLEPHQEWICNYLDRLNEKQKICPERVLPSDLIKGALAAIKNKESNPDWIAQSAHSYREILNSLTTRSTKKQKKEKTRVEKIGTLMEVLHEQKRAKIIAVTLNKTHLAFTKISHHFAEKKSREATIKIFKEFGIAVDEKDFPTGRDFANLIQVFENTLKESSLDPLKIHEKIDAFLKDKNKDVSYLRLLFSLSYDSKRYYFSQADETCLQWIWAEGLFDEIKKKAEVTTTYSYRLSELDYLSRIAEKNPAKVAEIIGSIKISEANFNPEVIDRFMWIIGSLPSEQIKTLTAKMRDEKWVYLMRGFHKTGYEFQRIVKKLTEKKESDSILELAQAMLLVKSKVEMAEKANGFGMDDPFYATDLDASGVFEAIAAIAESHKEKALKITTTIMAEIIKLASLNESKVFEYVDLFSLYDVDFFTLEIEDKHSYSYREDIKNLTATIKKLIQGTIGKRCDFPVDAKRLLAYIDSLPTCHAIWRLRLFTLAQCPSVFKDELKEAFFRLFEVENYYDIESGTEYQKALNIGFSYLSDADQRAYVSKVLTYFLKKMEEHPDQAWHKRTGWEIMSSICAYLTNEEAKKCEEVFGSTCNAEYVPKPEMGEIRSGAISPKSPVNLADFTIEEIIRHLKTDWSPKALREKFEHDDFFSPRGTEGLGDALKEDFKTRMPDYFKNLNDFFNRESIDPSYIYSILREVDEMLRNKKSLTDAQYIALINFFNLIRLSGEAKEFEKSSEKSWLADWITVHKIIADVLLNALAEIKDSQVFKDNRDLIFSLVTYLMSIKISPDAEDDKRESNEPAHVALNSVRGQAFRAFVQFTYNEGNTSLADDVKVLYEKILDNDSSNAVRFTIGQFFASFYFRDIPFITGLLPKIFPMGKAGKEKLYFATWEGYLASSLYKELFEALRDYYAYAITLKTEDYPDRKYLKGLDETLAGHLALAYAHFDLKPGDALFDSFWSTPNEVRHYEFASFIGRHYLTRDRASDEWLEESKVSKQKLIDFWDWIIKTDIPIEAKAFSGFGFWINPNKEIIDDAIVVKNMAATLKKSNGEIDWDYGLFHRIKNLAEINPEKALEIMKNLLLLNGNLNPHHRMYFDANNQFKEPLEIVYKADALKKPVEDFINALIEKGSSTFWSLKTVIKD